MVYKDAYWRYFNAENTYHTEISIIGIENNRIVCYFKVYITLPILFAVLYIHKIIFL